MYETALPFQCDSTELRAFESRRLEVRQDNGLRFQAFACALITIAFIIPFSESWIQSTIYVENLSADHVDPGTRDGRLDRQIAIGMLGLFGLATVLGRRGKSLQVTSILSFLFVSYLLWCAATSLWSDDFGLSLRRWIALMCEVMAGMAIAKRCSARQFVWIILCCTFTWLCLGICSELCLGTFQPWHEDYRFAGIFHPNTMGVNCALLTLAALYLATGEQRAGKWLYGVAAVASVFLLLTGSRTALAAMIASFAVVWYLTAPTKRKLAFATVTLLVALVGWIAASSGALGDPAAVIALGRTDSDATSLTGRVPLWEELLSDYLPPQQFVGYGYGAFWSEDRIVEISSSQGWSVPHAHSTYIDFVLNTGYIGAALCISVMVVALFAATRLETQNARRGFGFLGMILVFVMTGGLIETYIGFTWFTSFFVFTSICFLFYHDDQVAA
jgi:exopolysaccharide production protein ExoQ